MELNELRTRIDGIDDAIADLFKRRMDTVLEVAITKRQSGAAVLDPGRERAIVGRVAGIVGPEYAGYAKILYNTLFDLSRSYQNKVLMDDSKLISAIEAASGDMTRAFPQKAVVACQGVEGAYSQQACDKVFAIPDVLYFSRFEGVFQAVEAGLCQYGILPIENSAAGSVTAVYDLMKKYDFHIVRSCRLKIDHALLVNGDTTFKKVKEIVSHEQALSQCSVFLSQHPGIKVTVYENTATAAKYVKESGRDDIAAISSPVCAQLYGLSVLPVTAQNTDHNYTRFICISKDLEIYPGANRISLMLTTPHRPGALYAVIARIAALGLNLNKIESRPIVGKDFEFMFYFDIEASIYARETLSLLASLEKEQETFVFLGAYSEVS
jgi:chorismate mutase/prephenate dehydratase